MLTVFLNNKLISCDTILPVAMEVHARTGRRVRFITFDRLTFDAIRQNVVLWDAIGRIGRLDLLGSAEDKGLTGLLRRGRSLLAIAGVTAAALLGRTQVLHFRQLNYPPLDVIPRLAPGAVWFCESDSYGESELMKRVVEVGHVRQRDTTTPRGSELLAFSSTWSWLDEPSAAHLPRVVFGPTRTRRVWIDHVRAVAEQFHAQAGLADDAETLVFMLGYLGPLPYMRDPDSTRVLLRETLAVLAEEAGGRPIVLKPHVITDAAILEEELARLRGGGARFVTAHLHPSVLAVRARLFIANYYSTTLADAWHMGVPTIEYTDYSDPALAVTAGGSMNPPYVSHFLKRDPEALRQVVRTVLAQPRRALPEGSDTDPGGVLERLSGRAGAATLSPARSAA